MFVSFVLNQAEGKGKDLDFQAMVDGNDNGMIMDRSNADSSNVDGMKDSSKSWMNGKLNHAGDGEVCIGHRDVHNNLTGSYECSSEYMRTDVITNRIQTEDTNHTEGKGKDLDFQAMDIPMQKVTKKRKSRWKYKTAK